MDKLIINYRFQGHPDIVADSKGAYYQLDQTANKYTPSFRKLNLVLNNGITAGYRINSKFVSLHQLRKLAYETNEVIATKKKLSYPPY